MGCKCQCSCGNSEPTKLQKEERAARKKWQHYQKQRENSPEMWSQDKARQYTESLKNSPENGEGFFQRVRNVVAKDHAENAALDQKVMTLEQRVFDLQARLQSRGLPILP